MARQRRIRRPGLTLLEILVVMVILVALAAVAYPTLSAMYGDVKVKAAADQVRGSWTEARASAIEHGRTYRFSVEPNTGKFRVAPDAPEYWDGSGAAGTENDPIHVEEGTLTGPIIFEVPDSLPSDGTWTTVAIFNPDGSCQSDTEIVLKDDDGSMPIVVRVRAMTGAISVRKQTTEGR